MFILYPHYPHSSTFYFVEEIIPPLLLIEAEEMIQAWNGQLNREFAPAQVHAITQFIPSVEAAGTTTTTTATTTTTTTTTTTAPEASSSKTPPRKLRSSAGVPTASNSHTSDYDPTPLYLQLLHHHAALSWTSYLKY